MFSSYAYVLNELQAVCFRYSENGGALTGVYHPGSADQESLKCTFSSLPQEHSGGLNSKVTQKFSLNTEDKVQRQRNCTKTYIIFLS